MTPADLTGLGAAADAAKGILGMFFPDKTQQERDQLAAALALINGQTEIDKAEAMSSDPLQHWRGGLGWVCAFAYGYNFVIQPLMIAAATIAGHPVALPVLDITALSTLTLGMLGLGGLHVAERIKGAA
jgi:Holin of 3TMs, for gene-transfer release